jgi:hypothetical protein
VGNRLAGRLARQRPDLTGPAGDADNPERANRLAFRAVVLTLLAVDGVISAIFGGLLVQSRLGSVPFPISAVVSGLVNAALVWAGLQWTSSLRLGAVSLWTWLLTVAAMTLGGPGGGIIFGTSSYDVFALVLLLTLGVLPPAAVLWRHRRASR